jgi:hypothetical protein
MPEQTTLICTAQECTNPRADQAPEATNRHCRFHKAEAQRKYVGSKEEQLKARAWHKGVSDMTEYLIEHFSIYKHDSQRWSGPEIAQIIGRVKGPVIAATTE